MLEAIEKQKVTPKKMNATNTRGLNAVRQKIRKNNKDYQKDIDAYKEDKEAFMVEEEKEEVVAAPKKPKKSGLDAAESITDADQEGFLTVGSGGKVLQYTPESILKHLRTILEGRGRKNTDRIENIRIMERLLDVAANDYQRIRVLLTLVPTRYDLTTGSGNQMAPEQWKWYAII